MMNYEYKGQEKILSPAQELHELEMFCSAYFEESNHDYLEIDEVRRSNYLSKEQ